MSNEILVNKIESHLLTIQAGLEDCYRIGSEILTLYDRGLIVRNVNAAVPADAEQVKEVFESLRRMLRQF